MNDHPLETLKHHRVGQLATVGVDGQPHIVPVVFAISGESIVTAVDWKPKSGRKLQRIVNIESNPQVSFLVHHYSDDWATLWWTRVDGLATIHDGDGVRALALEALIAKYEQYREQPPDGAVISIAPHRVSSWTA